MADRYAKTELGRAEIRARAHPLSRTARNLLLIIDPAREVLHWQSMVQGATAEDLRTLVDAGLVQALDPVRPAGPEVRPAGAPPVATPAAPAAPAAAASAAADGAPQTLGYAELYDLLPSLGKEHLGLIKGFRFALAVEKAEGLAGLQQVARELVAEVERLKGPVVARSVQRALLMP